MSQSGPLSIVIYGAGGFAREVAWLLERAQTLEGRRLSAIAMVDDRPEWQGRTVIGIPVMSLGDARSRFPDSSLVVAVGDPHARAAMVEKGRTAGFQFATVIHQNAELSRWVSVGDGTVICAGNILTTNITIGAHVHLNLDCTVGHDVVLGDFVTVAPGVHISGNVHVQERAYVGTGAVIINGAPGKPLTIGRDAVVGAGACVTRSVPEGVTVVGVPARPRSRQ